MKYASVIIGILILAAMFSMIPAMLWYCFDDAIARALDKPLLGSLEFLNVYAFTWFMTMITTSKNSASEKGS